MLPDLETSIQQYRQGFIFTMQNHMTLDCIVFLRGMNQMLPRSKRIKVCTIGEVLDFNKIALKCLKCETVMRDIGKLVTQNKMGAFEITCTNQDCKSVMDITSQIDEVLFNEHALPPQSVDPLPRNNTQGEALELDANIMNWISNFHALIEGAISDYRTGYSGDKE